jgi:hypothetical protein
MIVDLHVTETIILLLLRVNIVALFYYNWSLDCVLIIPLESRWLSPLSKTKTALPPSVPLAIRYRAECAWRYCGDEARRAHSLTWYQSVIIAEARLLN